MTDLYLDGYEGLSKAQLREELKEEVLKMFGPESKVNDSSEKANDFKRPENHST